MKFELDKDEALVLFDLLARLSDDLEMLEELLPDIAERRVLWRIEGQLEKELAEPFMPNYPKLVEEARNNVRKFFEE